MKYLLNCLFASLITSLLLSLSPVHADNAMFTSATDLDLSEQTLSSAAAGRDISLNNVQVNGKLSAGRNVSCSRCSITGNIAAGQDVTLEYCRDIQHISSGRNTELSNSHVRASLASGQNVSLTDTTVERNVTAGNTVEAINSSIAGQLALGGHFIKLDGSTVGKVLFSDGHSSYININNGLINSGVLIGGRSHSSRGTSMLTVGNHSLSSVNGFTIKGVPGQTTVITPDQTIYVNGAQVSGDGPKTYAEYRSGNPLAPTVRGPGWDSGSQIMKPKSPRQPSNNEVVNVLELTNNSIIQGEVVFESGFGKVRVHKGSQLMGKVVNGLVENVAN